VTPERCRRPSGSAHWFAGAAGKFWSGSPTAVLPTYYPAAEAERRKVSALSILAARREALIRRARRALLAALLAGNGTATADDVRSAVELPQGVNPKAFGAAPGELATAGIIAGDGFVKSTRPAAHARHVQRWKVIDRAAAVVWLAIHPEFPDAEPAPDLGGGLFDFTNKKPGAATPGNH
jgi:hypothetical protein